MNVIECYGGDYRVSGDGEVYNSRGLPYTFKRGKLKGWTMIDPHIEIV